MRHADSEDGKADKSDKGLPPSAPTKPAATPAAAAKVASAKHKKRNTVSCSGEIDLSAAPVQAIPDDPNASSALLNDLAMLRIGDGPVRQIDADLRPYAHPNRSRALASATLPVTASVAGAGVDQHVSGTGVGLPFSPLAPWPIHREFIPPQMPMPNVAMPGHGGAGAPGVPGGKNAAV
jgi:hypothetical protein